jgi:hypothetical protein
MIEGLYILPRKKARLHQRGKWTWGNLNKRIKFTFSSAGTLSEARLKQLNWIKIGSKQMVMWDDEED